ncbi:hypothetical protein AAEO57_11655 [Flavobacterium sp. DGU38]|uniref:Uncharacterized protein n=1 Tax=Flavobacterium calami TaxID=3139144 RepID=A0ABU9IPR8_9FLAO
MNCKLTFKERAKLSMEQISKQKGVTLEQARAQAKWISEVSTSKVKKKRI